MRTAKNERICLDLVPLSERTTTTTTAAAAANSNSNNNNNNNNNNNTNKDNNDNGNLMFKEDSSKPSRSCV